MSPKDGSHVYGFPSWSVRESPNTDQDTLSRPNNLYLYDSAHVTSSPLLSHGGFYEGPDDDCGLDDFDRQLLGRPVQRVSVPSHAPTPHVPRVLGDASHHFRPFTQNSTSQSQFLSNPLQINRFPQNETSFAHRVQPTTPAKTGSSDSLRHASNFHQSSSPCIGSSSPTARLGPHKQRPQNQPVNTAVSNPGWDKNPNPSLEHDPLVQPVVGGTRLVCPRQALPDKFRTIFPFELFNVVQSKCFPMVYSSDDNVVVSAPTGSGKTAILEMAICRLIMIQGGDTFKIVYQAPTKSLCSERARDWEKKFSHMNMKCIELTGDTSQSEAKRVGSASIIVTTPEKWDSITRKWSDHRKLLEMVRLVLIDEVHILKDSRGATLEAVVSRMKTSGAHVRFVALSATVPNIDDIAKWLGRSPSNQNDPALFESFGEELRPVKLQKYVYGYDGPLNDFSFDNVLDGKLHLLLKKHSEREPIMIFCFTRRGCESTARGLSEWWSASSSEDRAWPPPQKRIAVVNQNLQELVRYGVAFHHAGLDADDRHAVERNYIDRQLHVICCTSTLAVGVNLPCHTVVLKGTVGYTDNGLQEYSDLEVMQILGRAGRPQFDDSATAVIMTRKANAERYSKMISGEEILESTLHRNLVEHLNSEVGLGTIQNIQTAQKWISGTFLSVRMRKSPKQYIEAGETVTDTAEASARMMEWCERDIRLLQEYQLITKNEPFRCTEYGNAMSRYMVRFETMKHLLSLPRAATMEQILTTLCEASEFREFRMKTTERTLLRKLNQDSSILYHVKEPLTNTWHKISLIIQIHLARLEFPNDKETNQIRKQITTEKAMIFDRANRLIRCVIDCKAHDGDAKSTRLALELARSLIANTWENKATQLCQIPGFGPVAARKWASHGVRTVLELAKKSFVDIERIASRRPPHGKSVLKILEGFPRLKLEVNILGSNTKGSFPPKSESTVIVTVLAKLNHENVINPPVWNREVPALVFLAETTDGNLAYFWRGNARALNGAQGLSLKFVVPLSDCDQVITCWFSCEEIVGTETSKSLKPHIPASAFPPPPPCPGQKQSVSPKSDSSDFQRFDELEDEDMMEALELSLSLPKHDCSVDEETEVYDQEFSYIEDVLSKEDIEEFSSELPPAKMENGKWMCNHPCRNGALTKSGKPCSHKCCREGVEKCRTKSQRHSKAASKKESERSEIQFKEDTRPASKPSKIRSPARLSGNKKRLAASTSEKGPRKSLKPNSHSKSSLDETTELSDIECIDLSNMTDDEDWIFQTHHTATKTKIPKSTNNQKSNAKFDKDISEYDYLDDDDDEFPDLEDLVARCGGQEKRLTKLPSAQDNTLYQGPANALKESVEYNLQPNLSFTTVDELQKASYRLDSPKTESPSVSEKGYTRVTTTAEPPPRTCNPQDLEMAKADDLSLGDLGGVNLDSNSEEGLAPEQNDPAWLSEFDPELIDSLRGCINFVD